MSLKVAIQLDPIARLNQRFDSSLVLGQKAGARGHEVYGYQPDALSFNQGKLQAKIFPLTVRKESGAYVPEAGEIFSSDLDAFDIILIRQDPPFDMAYITNTYLLENISKDTLVLNHPRAIRNAAEKFLPMHFKSYLPPTLITQDFEEIKNFAAQHGDIILKPLYEFGGHSVFLHKAGEGQLRSLYLLLKKSYPSLPFIIQPFLEDVLKGDKRIILFDGEIIGGFRRVPLKGEVRANMLMGGTPEACELTAREKEICGAVKQTLQDMGLFFVGLDIIGNYLIEINVTSPTGLVPLDQLNGIDSAGIFWDKVERIVKSRGENGSQYYNSFLPGNRSSAN